MSFQIGDEVKVGYPEPNDDEAVRLRDKVGVIDKTDGSEFPFRVSFNSGAYWFKASELRKLTKLDKALK